jgi:transcription antitermination factor NusG
MVGNGTPNVYPEALLAGLTDEPCDRRWWVIYTRSRQEKALARDLFGYGVPYYLPLVRKTNIYNGRRVSAQHPVFANYIFLFGSDHERVRCLTTNRVSRTLSVTEPERLLFDLRQLDQLIQSNSPLTVESRLVPGNRVRIRRGPLAGLEGTVLVRRGRARLLVRVDFLQQGASVEVEDFLLEPI